MNVRIKFEVWPTMPWDNRAYLKTMDSPWICPRSLVSKILNRLVNVPAKFEVRSFTRSWDNSGYLSTLGSPWICRSRSSKVVEFGTIRKRVCDFLLVRHGNIGPILHRFGDIAGFLCSWVTPPLFHPKFRGVPVASDHPCWGQPEQKA